ncbi:MAG TPA: response regulator [Vicinamibacterales bacterium]
MPIPTIDRDEVAGWLRPSRTGIGCGRGTSMRILVIDDQAAMVHFARRVLETAGHSVLVAADGRQAIALMEQELPDLVLTDLFMPERDGFETIRWLRSSGSQVPVIVMSGGGAVVTGDYLPMATTLGAAAVLKKPFTAEALLAAVDEALQTGRRQP